MMPWPVHYPSWYFFDFVIDIAFITASLYPRSGYQIRRDREQPVVGYSFCICCPTTGTYEANRVLKLFA